MEITLFFLILNLILIGSVWGHFCYKKITNSKPSNEPKLGPVIMDDEFVSTLGTFEIGKLYFFGKDRATEFETIGLYVGDNAALIDEKIYKIYEQKPQSGQPTFLFFQSDYDHFYIRSIAIKEIS